MQADSSTTQSSRASWRPRHTIDPQTITLLVVEDEAIVAQDLQQTLVGLGYQVPSIANHAKGALELIAEQKPHLVLMDVRLRGEMDGIEAAGKIREEFAIPVVYLTSHTDDTTLARAAETAPYGYLLKPFDERELSAAIQFALYRHQLERALDAAMTELERERTLFRAVIGSMEDSVIACDLNGNVLVSNDPAERLLAQGVALQHGPQSAYPFVRELGGSLQLQDSNPLSRALRGETVRQETWLASRLDAEDEWYSTNATPLHDADGIICGAVAVSRDITEQKNAEQELRRLSLIDELTGLYNRRGFQTLAEQQLKVLARERGSAALLFVDLDGMKQINDSGGHDAGDLMLRHAARILRESMRLPDIVARVGGDEFLVLALGATPANIDGIRERIERGVKRLNDSRTIGHDLSLSIGTAFFDHTTSSKLEDLMTEADRKMYEQKSKRPISRTRMRAS